ncbi:hypothetical protein [Hymenobacter sp. APR13]|uniref:hypothetical protein n=1 Tax=Hymenobacter sp. APR13 TaxID=1356852 RepID=UPI0004E0A1F6|nr:hypothetical protein [Hymenobacter sp. APR13]AII53831.1 hypothetical protein N008_17840 [Hymenobacter sp. APR13]
MRLENQQSTSGWRVAGLLMGAVALGLAFATGGAAFLPAVLLLVLGAHYAGRTQVEVVVLSEHFRTLTVSYSRWFGSSTRTFPLESLTARYQARGGLRSAKYYALALHYRGRSVAVLDPKAGYDQAQLDHLHAALLTSPARGAGSVTATAPASS